MPIAVALSLSLFCAPSGAQTIDVNQHLPAPLAANEPASSPVDLVPDAPSAINSPVALSSSSDPGWMHSSLNTAGKITVVPLELLLELDIPKPWHTVNRAFIPRNTFATLAFVADAEGTVQTLKHLRALPHPNPLFGSGSRPPSAVHDRPADQCF